MSDADPAGGRDSSPRVVHAYAHGLRASLGENAGAYSYSVTITASFGVLTTILGSGGVFEVFLFILGAATAFTVTELVASRGFRVRMRGERPEVVVLGSAIAYPSVLLGAGAAALAGEVLGTGVAWAAGSFLATVVFLLVGGIELLLGQRAARQGGVEERSE